MTAPAQMYSHADMKSMYDGHSMAAMMGGHPGHMTNPNFNHPFSITNLMSQQQQQQAADAKNMDLSKMYAQQPHHTSPHTDAIAQQPHPHMSQQHAHESSIKAEHAKMFQDMMQGQYPSPPYGHMPPQVSMPPSHVAPPPP